MKTYLYTWNGWNEKCAEIANLSLDQSAAYQCLRTCSGSDNRSIKRQVASAEPDGSGKCQGANLRRLLTISQQSHLAAAVDNFTEEPSGSGEWQLYIRVTWGRPLTISPQSHLAAAVDNFTEEPSRSGGWQLYIRVTWRSPLTTSQQSHQAATGDNFTAEPSGGGVWRFTTTTRTSRS